MRNPCLPRGLRPTPAALCLVLTIGSATPSSAQTPAPAASGAMAPPTPSPATPVAAPSGQGPAPSSTPTSDALLAPPPEAARLIQSWDEAIALIRAQSPDYVSSYESVVRAEAQRRIALAAVLPVLNAQGSYIHQFHNEVITFPTTPPLSFVSPPSDTFTVGASVAWSILNPRALYAVATADR